MAAGAGDHLMLNRLGLGEDNAETAGSSTVLVHEGVVRGPAQPSFFFLRCHRSHTAWLRAAGHVPAQAMPRIPAFFLSDAEFCAAASGC